MMPKVSVIMPVYNQKDTFLISAINCILNQTFQDFELIIVDDGSTDKKVIKEFESNHSKIKVLEHKTNQGIGSARNSGVQISKGKLISFLSSDDLWKPDFLELMVLNLDEGIIFCNYEIISGTGGRIRIEKVRPEDEIITYSKPNFEREVKFTAKMGTLFVNYSALLGERKYFEGENKFKEELKVCEDFHHIITICSKALFTYYPDHLISYRWHKGNTTHKIMHLLPEYNKKILQMLKDEGVDI